MTNTRASSIPNSIRSIVNAESTFPADRGALSWTASGAQTVTSVSVILRYTYSDIYVGIELQADAAGGMFGEYCDVAQSSRNPASNVWHTVELRTSRTGVHELYIGGTKVASCPFGLEADSSVSVEIGLHAHPITSVGFSAHFDSVLVTVRR